MARPAPGRRPDRRALRFGHLRRSRASAQPGGRAGATGARLGAVRAPAGAAPGTRAQLRLRDHDLATRVGPRPRRSAGPPRDRLGRRPPRRVDVRAPAAAVSDRGPAPTRRVARAPPTGRRRRRRLRLRAGRGRPAPARNRGTASDSERLGSRAGSRDRADRDRAAGSRPRLARLHGPLRQLWPGPRRAGRGAGPARARGPRNRRGARAGPRRAVDRCRGRTLRRRRGSGADRARGDPASAAGHWRSNARPTRCS